MTRPDLDVLESLLAKATPDTLRSALTIWEALPALIARVRESVDYDCARAKVVIP